MKYLAVVDRKHHRGFDFYELKACDIVTAMTESERFFNGDVYLIRLAERTGRIAREGGNKIVKFREILCNRSHGWHACDEEHSEMSTTWARFESVKYPDSVHYAIATL